MKKIKKTGSGGEIYSTPPGTIQESYGIDIEDQLSAILSQQIANSIDAEILKTLGVLSTPEKRMRSLNKIYKKN
jgi:hypothetical protein